MAKPFIAFQNFLSFGVVPLVEELTLAVDPEGIPLSKRSPRQLTRPLQSSRLSCDRAPNAWVIVETNSGCSWKEERHNGTGSFAGCGLLGSFMRSRKVPYLPAAPSTARQWTAYRS